MWLVVMTIIPHGKCLIRKGFAICLDHTLQHLVSSAQRVLSE